MYSIAKALTPGSGYTLNALEHTKTGLTAQLSLAGPACNAFGTDIANLTLEVTYETDTRYVHAFQSAFPRTR